MVLRQVIRKANDPAIQTERFKLLASGCQLIAIGILVAAIIAPTFNQTLHPGFWTRAEGGVAFAAIELFALHILSYIPVTPAQES